MEVRLADHCEITSSKRIYAKEYEESGIPFFRGKEIVEKYNGQSAISSDLFISETRYEQIKQSFGVPHRGDILLTSVGTIGVPYRVDIDEPFYFKDGNLTWFRNFRGIDSQYLFYWLVSPLGRRELSKCTIGAAQPAYTIVRLKEMRLDLPDERTQRAISGYLKNYDDLIENNKRRIELLEESARQLYKEWFVRFRFPGHEHVKIIDGVPEGWAFKPLKEIANITMGQSPKSEFYNSDGEGLPFHQGVTKFGFRFVQHETYCTKLTRLSQPGDILFSVRAPVGRLNITNDVIVLGRGLSAIHSIDGFQSFLFYALKSYFFKEDMIGGGAIYASVTKKDLENQELLMPSESLLKEFNDFGSDIDKQIYNLHQMNVNLTKARDLLLPKLMNGEIAV